MKKIIVVLAIVILAGIAAFKFIPTVEHTTTTTYSMGEGVATTREYINGVLVHVEENTVNPTWW